MFRPYNRNVLIGNWYEDRVLEEVIFLFIQKILFEFEFIFWPNLKKSILKKGRYKRLFRKA